MQVNRAFVALAVHLATADRADLAVVAIDDVIRLADGAHIDQAVRLLARGKPSVALGILQQRALFSQRINRLLIVGQRVLGFASGEGQLSRRARQVVFEDVLIRRIHYCVLQIAREKLPWVPHKVLVEGVGRRDEKDEGLAAGAAHAASALPSVDDRTRIADQHADVQAADVNAQLQGRRGHHAHELAAVELLLDLAALGGQIASPIRRNPLPQVRAALGSPAIHQFGGDAGAGEDNRAVFLEHAGAQHVGREGVGAFARVDEHEVARRGRRAMVFNRIKGAVEQFARQLAGIAHRRRAGDVHRLGPVVRADAVQAAKKVQDVGAKDAAVCVQLVDDHVAQASEEAGPSLVEGQDARVQHVRRGEEHVRRLGANLPAAMARSVAVVNGRAQPASQTLHQAA